MIVKDILEFNKKKYFGGAVQANWFYDTDKIKDITSSYVFHGPKYHGVGKNETTSESYKLSDTATYALTLLSKSKEKDSNRFNMTIAGYGTGKSHLSVALGSLLSGHRDDLRQVVIDNIRSVDKKIGDQLSEYSGRNLVLVLNGMRDFNLNSEILAVAKKAVVQHGLSDDIFSELTKQYQQAINFCKNTFDSRKERYMEHLSANGYNDITSSDAIITALENNDVKVFEAVNEVYCEFMGTYINVDSDISASDILTLLVDKYCKEEKIFDGIYILFDEFGRYIEFTANNPRIAGDSALQQIFEAIQNADGYIVFDAFIQSDLNSYIRRVESNGSNITRYVGRYENSDKYYLSSNFETILANLIEKKDSEKFKNIIEYNIDGLYSNYHKSTFMNLCTWAKPEIQARNVWISERMYFDVIAKGCYPIHPITVWFLANTSSWMQQRSTIAYTAEMFDSIANKEISPKWVPYIYPTDIIGTGLFNEMQASEEKGYVQSQNCMAYQSIIAKIGSKLSETEITVLRAVLIINILRFKFYERQSCLLCIRSCSGLNEDEVKLAVSKLENEHCVISFDENQSRFDLNAEAHGRQEFNLCILKKRASLREYDPIAEIDEELLSSLRLNTPENTSFGTENNISSSEWQFEKRLINISSINESMCNSLAAYLTTANDGEKYRGIIVYAYCGKMADRDMAIATKLIKKCNLNSMPIIFYLLMDREENWLYLLKTRAAYRKFTESEKEMYSRFIAKDSRDVVRKITSEFNRMLNEKRILTDKGETIFANRVNQLCLDKFRSIYNLAIPFSITEFDKKVTPSSKKTLLALSRNMYSGVMCNKQSYQGLDPLEKRRIQTAFATSTQDTSWQIFDSNFNLCEPKNAKVKKLYRNVMAKITPESQHSLAALFNEYKSAPYGLNYYSLFLFIIYVIALNSKQINVYDGAALLSKQEFIEKYLTSEKKMLENLLKVRITLKNQTDDELLEDLLSEINSLCYIEKCTELSKSLKKLQDISDNSDEFKGRIAACEYKLQEGSKLTKDLYTKLDKAEKIVDNCKKDFSLIKVVSVLKSLARSKVDTPINEYSEFLFSPTYCSRVGNVLDEATALLDSQFLTFVSNLKCAYSQSSEFKKQYRTVAKILSDIGKKDYANALKEKINSVLQNAELEQKYAATLSDAQRFISSMRSATETLDYEGCNATAIAIDGWIDTFSNAEDMNVSTRNDYLNQLSELRNGVELRKESLDKNIASVLDEIKNPTGDSTTLLNHIISAINLKPCENIMIELEKAKQLPDEFHHMRMNIDSNNISELETDYINRWKGTLCDNYMLFLIKSVKTKLSNRRDEWMRKNVIGVYTSIDTMTTAQCVKWQAIVSELPEFLEESDLAEITKLSETVREKIKSQRIQGVVEMFNALSNDEKIECLRILKM
jgi:hypothetical protein